MEIVKNDKHRVLIDAKDIKLGVENNAEFWKQLIEAEKEAKILNKKDDNENQSIKE